MLAAAALITAITGAALGLLGFWKSARAEDAKTTADLSRVGLEAVQLGQATLQRAHEQTLRELGEVKNELRHCKDDHRAAAARANEAVARAEELAIELAELKRSLP